MKLLVWMRILGTAFEVIGYFTQLHINDTLGILGFMSGQLLMIPFFIKTKAFDVVALLSLMFVISSTSLLFNYSIF